MDGDATTVTFVGQNLTENPHMWVEFEFKAEVEASKVILYTDCTPSPSTWVLSMEYWDPENQTWKPVSYFTPTSEPCPRYMAYGKSVSSATIYSAYLFQC